MDWRNKRVLITGGWGMIGTELFEQLVELGAEVSIADIESIDYVSLARQNELITC